MRLLNDATPAAYSVGTERVVGRGDWPFFNVACDLRFRTTSRQASRYWTCGGLGRCWRSSEIAKGTAIRKGFLCLASVSALFIALSTTAQTFDAALITESNTFNTDVFGATTSLLSRATIEAGPQPNFMVDYSTQGDTLLSVTWTAPAGQWIEIVPPTPGWGLESLALEFSLGTIGIGAGGIAPVATVSAEDFTSTNGLPPTLSASSFLTGPGGDFLTVGVSLSSILPGEAYSFSSLTAELTVPASYGIAFDNPILNYRIRGETEFRTSDPNPVLPADPGQWIRIVPEPASFTLLTLGGMTLLRRRGRQR